MAKNFKQMKTAINSIMVLFFAGQLFISCEKEGAKNTQLDLSGKLINISTCKNDFKSTSVPTITPDSLSCIEYSFDILTNKLTIKHINAGFNCCPDSIYCKISLKSHTIVVQEFEAAAQCNCICLYDLDIEINEVRLKKYQIKFIEPYVADQNKLIFEIDLTKDVSSSYCVTRKQYPWGINSLYD